MADIEKMVLPTSQPKKINSGILEEGRKYLPTNRVEWGKETKLDSGVLTKVKTNHQNFVMRRKMLEDGRLLVLCRWVMVDSCTWTFSENIRILLQSAHGVSAPQLLKFEGEKTDEIRVKGSKQGRDQKSNICYEPKVGTRREASSNVSIGHGYTRDIPYVAPTVGICSSPFQHSCACGGKFVSQGTMAHVQISTSDSGKQKVKRSDGCDVFEAYSQLCAMNMGARRSSVLTQTLVVSRFRAKQTIGPDVFRKNAALYAKNRRPRRNRGPGASSHSAGYAVLGIDHTRFLVKSRH
nr:hypothetical protein [Tanacetum cinerariifolium]